MIYFLIALSIWLIGIPCVAVYEYVKHPHLIPRGFYGWAMALIAYAFWPAPAISWLIGGSVRHTSDETVEAIEIVLLLTLTAIAVYLVVQ